MKYLYLFLLLCLAFPTYAEKLVTKTYEIEIGSCPEGYVSCNEIAVSIKHRETGTTKSYIGETMHSRCKDGVTPCQFRGYQFLGDIGNFVIYADGTLEVNAKSNQLILVEKGTWSH